MIEYLWITAASLISGAALGLVGLSNATVLVPVLVVLCPSFSTGSGTYAAITIALASDIISSAFTALVYYKNGNVSLKRSWIMLLSVAVSSILGSYFSSLIDNITLGSFSIILTLIIGLRFLLAPSSDLKDKREEKINRTKEIIISLFFGLTIGFGSGFIGSGGGMILVVVFSLFLKLDMKKSVGTTALIMTVSSLIGFLGHIHYDNSTLTEHLVPLLLCVILSSVTAVLFSIYANGKKNKTISYIAGALLTILSLALLIIRNIDYIRESALITGILECILEFSEYVFFGAVTAVIIFVLFKNFPKDIFRKLLHIIAFSSLVEMTLIAGTWYIAAVTALLFAAVIYPLLKALEGASWYKDLFVEKKKGEAKKSLILLFSMYALLITICWGLFDKRHIANAATLMWGVGDAFAAIVGRRLGKHKFKLKAADSTKSVEGSLAMSVSAFISGMAALLISGEFMWYEVVFYPLLAAPFASYTELISKNGDDTVTVPLVTAALLLILSFLF